VFATDKAEVATPFNRGEVLRSGMALSVMISGIMAP